MLKILVTYAVQGEFVEIKWPDVEPYYIRTGIGKVKSAFHLAEALLAKLYINWAVYTCDDVATYDPDRKSVV